MPVLTESALKMQLPKMIKIRQKFTAEEVTDVEATVRRELDQAKIRALIKPGLRIALTAGSRGICNMAQIIKTTGNFLQELGAKPFIVPAMGSHGGATAEGQREVLRDYGITEETMGMPIISSMEVDQIGVTPAGVPVYMDSNAHNADMVVLINRIKPHTSFRGPIESGLCKMAAIGLGKHIGCSRLHEEGWAKMSETVTAVATVVIEKSNIGFGLAMIENAYDKTSGIKVLAKDEIIAEEMKLQEAAKAAMPAILLPDLDVLVIEEMGKDISGAGMDPNIIGRTTGRKMPGFTGPDIQRIVVLSLTEATHGNASGIGNADFTTKKVFDNLDYTATYANMIAAGSPESAQIPIVMDDEREAVIAAIQCCKIGPDGPRIGRIKNTLDLGYVWVSENLLPAVQKNPLLEIIV